MFFDNTLMFSKAQAITADAASTNALELAGDDYSRMWIAAVVDTAFTFSGSPTGATIAAKVQTSDDSTFSTGVVDLATIMLDVKSATKGAVAAIRLPLGTKKYTRLNYDLTLTGGSSPAVTAGKITAGITDGIYTPQ